MLRRMGRPGLLGTMARTAAVAGTASAVTRGMNRAANAREEQRAAADAYHAEQQAQPASPQPAPSAGGEDDVIAKLEQLGELHESGVLSDEEFAAAKAKLLA